MPRRLRPLGTAIAYALNLWPKLSTYLEDGAIPIDNNKIEKPVQRKVKKQKAQKSKLRIRSVSGRAAKDNGKIVAKG